MGLVYGEIVIWIYIKEMQWNGKGNVNNRVRRKKYLKHYSNKRRGTWGSLSVTPRMLVLVEPAVVLDILNHHNRRTSKRVIGSLLGKVTKNALVIQAILPVPHSENEEKVSVDREHHEAMLNLHSQVHDHILLGWYSTGEIDTNTSIIHDFYGRELESPLLLLVGEKIRAYFDLEKETECRVVLSEMDNFFLGGKVQSDLTEADIILDLVKTVENKINQ